MEFSILGPLEAREGNRLLALGGARQRGLLALLLLHVNEVVSSERLVAELWEPDGSDGNLKALQVAVSRLRRALEPDLASGEQSRLVITRPPGYQLCLERGQLDLHRFEDQVADGRSALARGDAVAAARELEAALGLWRGEPLADLRYESFAQEAIGRLEELRAAAIEEHLAAGLELGRHAELIGDLRALTERYPLRERLREQLMLALYRSGRQADALAVYRAAREQLVDELGIEPGAGLKRLERAILAQDPALTGAPSPAEGPPSRAPASNQASPSAGVASMVLVGRQRERNVLRGVLAEALGGRGQVLLLSGEAGIGKSRLLEELAGNAREQGAQVLWGRCWEAGGAPAYWPWVQSLRAYVRDRDRDALLGELGGRSADLAALLPELRELAPGSVDAATPGSEGRFRLFDALASFLVAAARSQPLVIVLDDLHAADEPSLLLLQFVAGQLEGAPLLIAAAYRDSELERNAPLAQSVGEVARERAAHALSLGGLDEAEVGELIETSAGVRPAKRSVAAIRDGTEGNPLFVGEVVRLLSSEGRLAEAGAVTSGALPIAPGVREVIGRRLKGLSEPCRGTLSLAAVLGREFDFDALASVSERSEEQLLDSLDEALRAQVVSDVPEAPGRLRFAHVLIRDTLYAALSGPRRLRLHRQVGEALEALYADDREPHSAELAHHFIAAAGASEPGKAVGYARGAGDRAVRLAAYEEAVRLYGMAVAALDRDSAATQSARGELLIALADAQARAGDDREAKATFLRVAELARSAELSELLARAAVGYGGRFVWHRARSDERLVPLLEDALTALDETDSAVRVQLLCRLAAATRGEPSRERRERLVEEAVAGARRLGDPATLAYVLNAAEAALTGAHGPERWLVEADEIISLAAGIGDRERVFDGHEHAFWAAWQLGDADRRAAELASLTSVAEALRQPAHIWLATIAHATVALSEGRFGEAEHLIERATTLGGPALGWNATAARKTGLYLLYRAQGRLERFEPEVRDAGTEFYSPLLYGCVLAHVEAGLGHTARAREVVDGLARHDLANWHLDEEWLVSICVLADACAVLGDVEHASRVYGLLLPYGRLNAVAAGDIGIDSVSRPLGTLAALLGRFEDAARHFEDALEMNTRMRARPWIAHTEEQYARMLAVRGAPGDRQRALELAVGALEGYRSLGMDSFAAEAAQLEQTLSRRHAR